MWRNLFGPHIWRVVIGDSWRGRGRQRPAEVGDQRCAEWQFNELVAALYGSFIHKYTQSIRWSSRQYSLDAISAPYLTVFLFHCFLISLFFHLTNNQQPTTTNTNRPDHIPKVFHSLIYIWMCVLPSNGSEANMLKMPSNTHQRMSISESVFTFHINIFLPWLFFFLSSSRFVCYCYAQHTPPPLSSCFWSVRFCV